MASADTPSRIEDLIKACDLRRRGVSDPVRLGAAELHNITDTLVEILKQLQLLQARR